MKKEFNERLFQRYMMELGVPTERTRPSETNANWFLRQGITYHNHHSFVKAREAALRLANG